MRVRCTVILLAALGGAVGCSRAKRIPFDGPTVDAFTGRVTHDGKPVSFAPEDNPSLKLFHEERGISFGIPLEPNGTFKIGWMPIGKYFVLLFRGPRQSNGRQIGYGVPGGSSIVPGKTEYAIELGKEWTPDRAATKAVEPPG
jgi:hypothetical protein